MYANIPAIPFTIESRGGLTRFSDIARTFNWQMLIPTTVIQKIAVNATKRGASISRPLSSIPIPKVPNIPSITGISSKLLVDEDLLVKCRSVTIPSKTVSQISTSFMGHKRNFPSKVEFSHNLDIEFEENELMTIKIFFDNWISAIEETDFRHGGNSGARTLAIENYTTSLYLSLIAYNGVKQAKNFTFYNCFPTAIKEVVLAYSDNGAIKYGVSFSFDFYELGDEPFVRVPLFS